MKYQNRRNQCSVRNAITLIELLVVIAIMAKMYFHGGYSLRKSRWYA